MQRLERIFQYNIPFDLPEDVEFRVQYRINIQHRDGNHNKSQWIISEQAEFECFERVGEQIYFYGLGKDKACWGLHFEESIVKYLGVSALSSSKPRERLFIAKFVSDHAELWHGYPANPTLNAQDIPTPDVLEHWLAHKYLNRATIRKIIKGQKCKL